MLERLLDRFRGCASYENGVRTILFAKAISQGTAGPFNFTKIDTIPITDEAAPIIAVNRVRKQQIPYESEKSVGFSINYKDQDDVANVASGFIPAYADQDVDFKIQMPEDNSFCREITGIEKREDKITFTLSNVLSQLETSLKYNLGIGAIGWEYSPYITASSRIMDSGAWKYTATYTGVGTNLIGIVGFPIATYMESPTSLNDLEIAINNGSPFHTFEQSQFGKFKIRFKLESSTWVGIILLYGKKSYVKFYATDPATPCEIVAAGVWHTKEFSFDDMLQMGSGGTPPPFNQALILTQFGSYNSDGTHSVWIEYVSHEYNCGNLGDTFEILGPIGNIARHQAVKALMLSDIAHNLRAAALQKIVQMAYSGGLKLLAEDFGIYLTSYLPSIIRTLTRLFSSFVIPSATTMQASMTTIYNILDPDGFIVVTPIFSPSAYHFRVDVFDSDLEFTDVDVAILLLFIERYRPVPATYELDMNFDFELEDTIVRAEEGEVDITSPSPVMSMSTIMGPSTIMGTGTLLNLTFPANYP